jgi:restriction system protein
MMSRRHRESGFDAVVDLASRLPWWLGIILALLSYLVLHPFAVALIAPPADLQAMGGAVTGQIYRTLAMFGQYLLPVIFLLGAAGSAVKAYRNRKLFAEVRLTSDTADLMDLSWRDFEHLVGEAFRQRGFVVDETPSGPDGGVDLELRRDGELHLVQCKRWRARQVGVEIVREIYGVMSARGAVGGYVVSSGTFSAEARRFAQGRNIEIWDGTKLKAVIRGVQDRPAPGVPTRAPSVSAPRSTSTVDVWSAAPVCPICGSPMVHRTARRGANSGREFWGCSRYPACKGVRQAKS